MELPSTTIVSEPQLAATVLLVRDHPLEVLMVKRGTTGSFPSKQVFPGGGVDPEDWSQEWLARCKGAEGLERKEIALRIAGLRECWEETGVLCASGQFALDRHYPGGRPLADLMDHLAAKFELDAMAHFAHWTTPTTSSKRWNTRLYISKAPSNHQTWCDGKEIVAAEWMEPALALELAEQGELDMLFSTKLNLHLLACSATADEAILAARTRPQFEICPWTEEADGRILARISPDAGYPVSEGWLE